jgi:hypothetical protein
MFVLITVAGNNHFVLADIGQYVARAKPPVLSSPPPVGLLSVASVYHYSVKGLEILYGDKSLKYATFLQ